MAMAAAAEQGGSAAAGGGGRRVSLLSRGGGGGGGEIALPTPRFRVRNSLRVSNESGDRAVSSRNRNVELVDRFVSVRSSESVERRPRSSLRVSVGGGGENAERSTTVLRPRTSWRSGGDIGSGGGGGGAESLERSTAVRREGYYVRRPHVESEVNRRAPVTGHCAWGGDLASPSAGMLPGVEVARRRRIRQGGEARDLDAFDGGVGMYEGHRVRNTEAPHLYHQSYYQRPSANRGPLARSSGNLIRRMQEVLQQHRNNPTRPQRSSTDRANSANSSTSGVVVRGSGRQESHASASGTMRRGGESAIGALHRVALEARNRLDHRLRAAAIERDIRQNWGAADEINLEFSSDEEEIVWSDDHVWESTLLEMESSWASRIEDRWSNSNNMAASEPGRSISGNMRSIKEKSQLGMSKAAINALPRRTIGCKERQKTGGRLEQEDCPVCLEQFMVGQSVLLLRCNHRFHPDCLIPWLSSHTQCPFCRAEIAQGGVNNRCRAGVEDISERSAWVAALEREMNSLNHM